MPINTKNVEQWIVKMPYPGHVQTWINDDGRPAFHEALTVEEYLKDNPDMKIVDTTELIKLQAAKCVTSFKEITHEQWMDALECLPPLKWHRINANVSIFFCSEAWSGSYHSIYLEDKNGRYYSATICIYTTDDDIIKKYTQEVLTK